MNKKNLILLIDGIIIVIFSSLFYVFWKTCPYGDLNDVFYNTLIFQISKYLIIVIGLIGILLVVLSFIYKKEDIKKLIILSFMVILCSFGFMIYSFIGSHIVLSIRVNGNSMEPNIHDEEVATVYLSKKINYEDIIVFKVNENDNYEIRGEKYYIKRVIGMSGDSIKIIDRKLYINDSYVDEKYYSSSYLSSLSNYQDFDGNLIYKDNGESFSTNIIPEGYIFVLGDNRLDGASLDSRFIGLIKISNIVGKVVNIKG